MRLLSFFTKSHVSKRVMATSTAGMSFYALSATRSDGSDQPMKEFEGMVVYATNVASK